MTRKLTRILLIISLFGILFGTAILSPASASTTAQTAQCAVPSEGIQASCTCTADSVGPGPVYEGRCDVNGKEYNCFSTDGTKWICRAPSSGSPGCAAALISFADAVEHARRDPSGGSAAQVTARGLAAVAACKREPSQPPPPLPPDPTTPAESPAPIPPEISPGTQVTPPESGGGGCAASASVSYGVSGVSVSGVSGGVSRTSASSAAGSDPSSATVRLDWGDGTSTTQTLAWGSTVTLSHNYYYSSSPYPRSTPGVGSDGDPDGDGSDIFAIQATVLETGARSGYGVVEHVGPFPPDITPITP